MFDTFTDQDHVLNLPGTTPMVAGAKAPGILPGTAGTASVAITSSSAGADIEVDGAYVGSTPTTLALAAGSHQIVVHDSHGGWQRTLQVGAGSTITVNAQLDQMQSVARKSR